MFHLICWNINSIKARFDHLKKLLESESPDFLLLQETKCQNINFPKLEINDWGYNCIYHGEKTFNGVSILSKNQIEDVKTSLPGEDEDTQCRFIECNSYDSKGLPLKIISVYVPNGQDTKSDKFQYKLRFFKRLKLYIEQLIQNKERFVIAGDFNVAPNKTDVYNHQHLYNNIGHHPDEISRFRKILNLGVYDSFRLMNPEKQEFSWWDYRHGGWQNNKGMRIDHILVSSEIADILKSAGVLDSYRNLDKPSDHAPIYIEV